MNLQWSKIRTKYVVPVKTAESEVYGGFSWLIFAKRLILPRWRAQVLGIL